MSDDGEFRSGFREFEGQVVLVQLVEPYIAGKDAEGNMPATPILLGTLRITEGHKPGQMLFILDMVGEGGTTASVTIYPEDVKHVSRQEQWRLVR
jgi:hypothetical protein